MSKSSPPKAAPPLGDDDGPDEVALAVAGNLRRVRVKRGLSLERLAEQSGVSRSMLGQIELGQSLPTIKTLWRIATALGLPFAALLSQPTSSGTRLLAGSEAKALTSQDGSFVSRALFPFDGPRGVEFYQLKLAPHSQEQADAHAPGTRENLFVAQGALELGVRDEQHHLVKGDAILFAADAPHLYRNPGATPTVMYLVMTYTDDVGR